MTEWIRIHQKSLPFNHFYYLLLTHFKKESTWFLFNVAESFPILGWFRYYSSVHLHSNFKSTHFSNSIFPTFMQQRELLVSNYFELIPPFRSNYSHLIPNFYCHNWGEILKKCACLLAWDAKFQYRIWHYFEQNFFLFENLTYYCLQVLKIHNSWLQAIFVRFRFRVIFHDFRQFLFASTVIIFIFSASCREYGWPPTAIDTFPRLLAISDSCFDSQCPSWNFTNTFPNKIYFAPSIQKFDYLIAAGCYPRLWITNRDCMTKGVTR